MYALKKYESYSKVMVTEKKIQN